MSSDDLIGKKVMFYMVGGWEISGVIEKQSPDKIVISNGEDLYIAFRDNISMLKMLPESAKLEKFNTEKSSLRTEDADGSFPENGISYTETFLSLPGNLLSEEIDNITDLGISFSKPSKSNINFRLEE